MTEPLTPEEIEPRTGAGKALMSLAQSIEGAVMGRRMIEVSTQFLNAQIVNIENEAANLAAARPSDEVTGLREAAQAVADKHYCSDHDARDDCGISELRSALAAIRAALANTKEPDGG